MDLTKVILWVGIWEVGKHCHKFFAGWNSWNVAVPFFMVLGWPSLSFVMPGISPATVEGRCVVLVYNYECITDNENRLVPRKQARERLVSVNTPPKLRMSRT